MINRCCLSVLFFFTVIITCHSQEIDWISTSAGKDQFYVTYSENVWDVEVTDDHVFVTGFITGSGASFGDIKVPDESKSLNSNNDYYNYLACYDRNNGKALWLRRIPFLYKTGIAVDKNKDIWVAYTDHPNSYIRKYNKQGDLLSEEQINIDAQFEVTSIATDNEGGVIAAGILYAQKNTILVEGKEYTNLIDNSNYNYNIIEGFIIKYNKEGGLEWFTITKGNNECIINDIATDGENNIILAGEFSTQPDKFIKFGDISLTSGYVIPTFSKYPSYNGFVAKITSAGEFLWVKNIEGQHNSWTNKLSVNNQNEIHVIGTYSNSATLDGTELKSKGGYDIFFTKLNSGGDVIWLKSEGGSYYINEVGDIGRGIATDEFGNVFITGSFLNSITFVEEDGTVVLKTDGVGNRAGFVAQFTGKGNFVWAEQVNGPSGANSEIQAVATVGTDAYIGGKFFKSNSFFNKGLPIAYAEVDHTFVASIDYRFTVTSLKDLVDISDKAIAFPNPTSGRLKFDYNFTPSHAQTLQVIDVRGNTVLTIQNFNTKTEIDITSLTKGVYTLVVSNNHTIIRKKIVKL